MPVFNSDRPPPAAEIAAYDALEELSRNPLRWISPAYRRRAASHVAASVVEQLQLRPEQHRQAGPPRFPRPPANGTLRPFGAVANCSKCQWPTGPTATAPGVQRHFRTDPYEHLVVHCACGNVWFERCADTGRQLPGHTGGHIAAAPSAAAPPTQPAATPPAPRPAWPPRSGTAVSVPTIPSAPFAQYAAEHPQQPPVPEAAEAGEATRPPN